MKLTIHTFIAAALMLGVSAGWGQEQAASPQVYQSAAKYQFGQSRKDLAAIEAEIRSAKVEQYPAIEARLLPLLKSADSTTDAKRYICRYLGIVGSSASIPTLAGLLADEQLSHPARIALEPMADAAAEAALRHALGQVKGKLLAGVIASLGTRRDNDAVPALAELIGSEDPMVSSAAISALGAIGTADSAKALQNAVGKAPQPLRIALAKALTNCADRLARSGGISQAAAIYRSLADGKYPTAQRIAGITGLIAVSDPIEAAATTIVMLNDDDADMRTAGITAFNTQSDKGIQHIVVERLATLKPAGQLAVLAILPDRPKLPARSAILSLLKTGNEEIQLAALNCLAVHGESDDVPMLAALAVSGSPAQKAAAAGVLARLGKAGTDARVTALLGSADAATRTVAINAISARHTLTALPQLGKLSQGDDPAAAAQAIAAIGTLGGAEQLPPLMSLLLQSGDDSLRLASEKAAGDICARIADGQITGPIILGGLQKASSKPARIAVLHILPRVKGEAALAAITQATTDADADIREAAIRTLADWPELSAAALLFDLAEKADSQRLSIIAIQGCIRLAGQKAQPAGQRLAIYRQVMASAKRIEDKRQAIAGMGDVANINALEELAKYAPDKDLAADAARAAVRLSTQRGVNPRPRIIAALQKFKAQPLGPAVMRQVDGALARLSAPAR